MVIGENICSLEAAPDLAILERVIASGIEKFTEVAAALATIRDNRLYLQSHDTFEAYCREKWSMSARRTYQLISAKGVCDDLSAHNLPTPRTEGVARVLASLPIEEARRIWTSAVNYFEGRVTASGLKQLVNGQNAGQFQPIDTFSTDCPNCKHRFTPIIAEKASRGPMWPAKSVKWALGVVGGDSAADYGCGKFRNSRLIASKFRRVVCVDTTTQVERIRRYKPEEVELMTVDEFSGAARVDTIFLIAVLHIVPAKVRKIIADQCMAQAGKIVVDVPMAMNYYRNRKAKEFDDGWLMSGNTFYKNVGTEELDRLFAGMKPTHKMSDNQHIVRVYGS